MGGGAPSTTTTTTTNTKSTKTGGVSAKQWKREQGPSGRGAHMSAT